MARKRRDRGAQFIRSNLELLGFGTCRDALVQAVKELFENALDATQALSSEDSWDDAPLELLRVNVKLNEDTGSIDIVCADTGSGIHAHQVKLLCCSAFETTKTRLNGGGACTSGKYGVGLKAAMLYSQIHASDACLKITTTSKSDGILHVQLRIDPDSEETAVVKKVAHFVVDENHQHFSGTEMRLAVPCPEDTLEVERAADTLALYFQTLRYTAPPFVSVQFNFDVGEVSTSVECRHKEEPLDRFAADLRARADDILYAVHDDEFASISCAALMLGDTKPGGRSDIEVCLLRFANHTPLVNSEDFFLCGITKGVCSWKVWRKYGLRCQRTDSHLVNQLVARPLRASTGRKIEDADEPIRLVLAIDVCATGVSVNSGIKYATLKKSTLDAGYATSVQTCCRSILQQLAESGRLSTPQQQQDHDILENFAPLISKSLAAIVKQSQAGRAASLEHDRDHFNEELILRELQGVLRN
ncbi:Histidine kinase-/DNA gyrase B-/HSP90-like ATPase [Phytophthora infestans]|uniref:Histidine kinase-/DNA gyrase B-/HSP90-like ATPase n=1 Tax=Phytophthora infestans TaxID=4787 RepID=A0A833WNN5_PHYIN|nr:Histidine kinase-/DNA gyrase B-/HSP90-like ATPase [Phytophthora infestans]KAF4132735.1 Histidine kinase-/DNA gyrase B-/HSP90-like ATPase [Phytophthora infestans]